MVFQTEEILKEMEGKISADEKAKVEDRLEALKKALEGDDTEDIKKKTEELTNEFHAISQKMYEQAAQQQQAQQGADGSQGSNDDDDVVDADYEVVDDDDK